jgi:hypothetical protein
MLLAVAVAVAEEVKAEGLACAKPPAEWAAEGGKPPIC